MWGRIPRRNRPLVRSAGIASLRKTSRQGIYRNDVALTGTLTLSYTSGCTPTDSITKNGNTSTTETIAQGAAAATVVTDGAGHYYVSGS
jgi:hypothetical protein